MKPGSQNLHKYLDKSKTYLFSAWFMREAEDPSWLAVPGAEWSRGLERLRSVGWSRGGEALRPDMKGREIKLDKVDIFS